MPSTNDLANCNFVLAFAMKPCRAVLEENTNHRGRGPNGTGIRQYPGVRLPDSTVEGEARHKTKTCSPKFRSLRGYMITPRDVLYNGSCQHRLAPRSSNHETKAKSWSITLTRTTTNIIYTVGQDPRNYPPQKPVDEPHNVA